MTTADNDYTRMQKRFYEEEAPNMNEENHASHNRNPDYWEILVKETGAGCAEKTGLDFGCGCGRNIMNLWKRFTRMDGCDISQGNLGFARENVRASGCPYAPRLYQTDGVSLSGVPSDEYDFVVSTIVLQHIPVWEIRFQILKGFHRVLRPAGLLSFQMGYGDPRPRFPELQVSTYYENTWEAKGTNSRHDVVVTDLEALREDVLRAGFHDIQMTTRPSFQDHHPSWVFVKARKP